MPERRFLLGVGAQKAGTTWLHKYIGEAPGTVMGIRKEYHVWDAVYTPECARFKARRLSRNHLRRWLMQQSERYYFNYFDRLLRKGNITGDITPAYSSLKADVFRRIRDGLEARDMECKVIFLMRDPVDRCVSAIRMVQRRNGPATADEEASLLARHYRQSSCEIHTRYDQTITELEKVFRPEDIYYGIYEEMFEEENIERLSDFIGIEPNASFRERRFNFSETKSPIPEALRAEIASHYGDVYRFCAERFPQTRDLWPAAGSAV